MANLTFKKPASPQVTAILAEVSVRELGPGRPVEKVRPRLAALTESDLLKSGEVIDPQMARCCLAGLWLAFDFLDESHRLSQEIHTQEGSYWHGIMHRREPDYANSKYWFARVREHPVYSPLARQAAELATGRRAKFEPGDDSPAAFLRDNSPWRPERFIDLCETAAKGGHTRDNLALVELCKAVADLEWRLLFQYCFERIA